MDMLPQAKMPFRAIIWLIITLRLICSVPDLQFLKISHTSQLLSPTPYLCIHGKKRAVGLFRMAIPAGVVDFGDFGYTQAEILYSRYALYIL